jgi:hypothetical protein
MPTTVEKRGSQNRTGFKHAGVLLSRSQQRHIHVKTQVLSLDEVF